MILPIYTFGQPVLRKVAQDIPVDYPDLQQLIKDMFETLDASSGVGLAAPQIGKSIRVVVIDLDVLKEDFPQDSARMSRVPNASMPSGLTRTSRSTMSGWMDIRQG